MATPNVTYTFAPGTLIKASEANTNFADLVAFLTNETIHKDGSVAFTQTPSGPTSDPATDDQFTRKGYVDARSGAIHKIGTSADTTLSTSYKDFSGGGISVPPGTYVLLATCETIASSSSGTNALFRIYNTTASVPVSGERRQAFPVGGAWRESVVILDVATVAGTSTLVFQGRVGTAGGTQAVSGVGLVAFRIA